MGRKRMADRVRRDIRLNAGLCRVLLDELPEALTAHEISRTAHKEKVAYRPF